MIKVLHLISNLNCGGAEKQLSQLVIASDPQQFKHIVVSMQDYGQLGANLIQKNIMLYTLKMKRGRVSILGIFRLMILIFKERPHILQSWLYHADLLGLLVGKLNKTPKIVWNVRCSNMDVKYYSRLTASVIKLCSWFSSFPSAIIVNSKAGLTFHKTLGYQAKHWEWIPNGFQTDRYKPNLHARNLLRTELQIDEQQALIGMIARWDPMKDHFTFLSAAQQVLKLQPHARFAMVGHGMEASNLKLMHEIQRLEMEPFIYLLGSRQDIPEVLNALDVLVLSSKFGEGFPNVIGEAMATGILCVATDVGDAALIIADTGKVVEPCNASQLSDTLVEMLTLPRKTKEEFSKIARQRIAALYETSVIVKKYETFYQSLLTI